MTWFYFFITTKSCGILHCFTDLPALRRNILTLDFTLIETLLSQLIKVFKDWVHTENTSNRSLWTTVCFS